MESKADTKAAEPTVVVICGASRGIGLEFVTTYVKRPETIVFATARTLDTAKALNDLKSKHSNLHVLQLAVDDAKSIAAFAAELAKQTKYVDVLINNAGTMPKADGPKDLTFDAISSTIATNAIGPVMTIQSLAPLLSAASKLRGKGRPARAVNISSMVAQSKLHNAETITAWKFGAMTAYRTSKTSLNVLTRAWAIALPDIIVYAQCPGAVKTDMNPMGFLTTAESVAAQLKVIEGATYEHSGRFFGHTGDEYFP